MRAPVTRVAGSSLSRARYRVRRRRADARLHIRRRRRRRRNRRANPGIPSRVYNIGGGSRVSMNQVLEMIARVTGRRPLITVDPAQKGDMRHTYADTRLARTESGFEPTVGLDERLAAEHQWLAGLL